MNVLKRLSLTQIAELMNFASLSYFSRYCTKHFGQSPSEYRRAFSRNKQTSTHHIFV